MGDYAPEHGCHGNHAGGFIAGLLLGGLVGAGAMLLVAPHSGKETRAVIRQEGVELRDRMAKNVEGAVAQVRGKACEITVGARKKAEELQQDGLHCRQSIDQEEFGSITEQKIKDAAHALKHDVEDVAQDAKNKAKDAAHEA